jgi:hypothetical protein
VRPPAPARVVPAAALALLLAGLPLLLPSGLPTAWRVVTAVLLAAAAAAAVLTTTARVAVGVVLALWYVVALAPGDGPAAEVAVTGGVLLRLWCGLPELLALGRRVLPDLAPDLLGGAAAAALVVAVARREADLPAVAVVAALAGSCALVGAAVLRVRR